MMYRQVLEADTKPNEYADLTQMVSKVVADSGIKEGICHVFVAHTTAGIIVNENDSLLITDFRRFFKIIDENKPYAHPENAHSHLRASLTKTEYSIPVSRGKLLLGKWQSILLWEFDTSPRKRRIIVTVSGE